MEQDGKEDSWIPTIIIVVITAAFYFGGAWIGGIVFIITMAIIGWDKRHEGPFPTKNHKHLNERINYMTSLQQFWVVLFNFGPAILLSMNKHWWLGIVAFILSFILSWVLFFLITPILPLKLMSIWAWIKPPLIASFILTIGFSYF